MTMPVLPGSFEFVRMLKSHGVQIGLVTSSDDKKLAHAFHELPFMEGLFNTIVSANRITRGKPDPMCYLLAAQDFNRKPEDCLVFEDSFAGICRSTEYDEPRHAIARESRLRNTEFGKSDV